MAEDQMFTPEQTQYLQGFAAGSGLAHSLRVLPTFAGTLGLSAEAAARPRDAGDPSDPQRAAQDRFITLGKKLVNEETAKRATPVEETWGLVAQYAREGKFPKGTDVFLSKFQGMFYVAPAQDSFMCRLRLAGGIMRADQLRGVADLAEKFGGGYADVTTRANLQIREIKPFDTIHVLEGLHDLGIINRGAGADNIRNITASPTAGIDPQELIDTSPLARELHHHILNHRELFGLPRKFNIAFDGGGTISTLEDTNDIGFAAVRVSEENATADTSAGVYFRVTLGGITGHKDFARDTGILVKPDECLAAAHAIVRAFIDHGDRTDRKKARLKYVLESLGFDGFLAEARKHLPFDWRKFPVARCDPRPPTVRDAHIGAHPQKQAGLSYVGVVLPVGRMTCEQMRSLASIAERYGSRTIRLTVWQNLVISDIRDEDVDAAEREIDSLKLSTRATSVRAGLVACTGSAGCKYAASNTKRHALAISEHLDARLDLDVPINIHLTGCHHSCAQHYIGDIGLLGAKVPIPGSDDMAEGYHLYVGGGYADQQAIGRELYRDVVATELPRTIERILRGYLDCRTTGESFHAFVTRHPIDELREAFETQPTMAEVVEAA